MNNELTPDDACMAVTTPWFYDAFGEWEMKALRENRAKLLLYDGADDTWGYVWADYAPEMDAWIREHYVRYMEDLWIRKDFWPEARGRLEAAGYGMLGLDTFTRTYSWEPVKGVAAEGYAQRFRAEGTELTAVYLMIGTQRQICRQETRVQLFDPESGELLGETARSGERVSDNFLTRMPLAAPLIPGREYELRLLPGLARWPYQLVLYRTPAGLATEGDYALDDGVPSDSSWVLALEYAADYDTMALLQ